MFRVARLAILFAALVAAGCGVSREGARDRAVTHACDRLQDCGNIGSGSGKLYSTREDCEVEQRSLWTNVWPEADCTDQISGDALDLCLQSIDRTACGFSLDIFSTGNVCKKESVCSGR
jgi:hypothetical protein